MAITSKDIAKLAGVSRSAVSAVLNGHYNKVSLEKREKILAIAQDLRYRPNPAALILAKKKTKRRIACLLVAIIIAGSVFAYFDKVAMPLVKELAEADVHAKTVSAYRKLRRNAAFRACIISAKHFEPLRALPRVNTQRTIPSNSDGGFFSRRVSARSGEI